MSQKGHDEQEVVIDPEVESHISGNLYTEVMLTILSTLQQIKQVTNYIESR